MGKDKNIYDENLWWRLETTAGCIKQDSLRKLGKISDNNRLKVELNPRYQLLKLKSDLIDRYSHEHDL